MTRQITNAVSQAAALTQEHAAKLAYLEAVQNAHPQLAETIQQLKLNHDMLQQMVEVHGVALANMGASQ
jgi:hypothetical protein